MVTSLFNFAPKKEDIITNLEHKITTKHNISKKDHWVVIDEVSDFLLSKVQGFGVIRQSFIPLMEEIKKASQQPSDFTKFLISRSRIISHLLWLALWETYTAKSKSNESFHR